VGDDTWQHIHCECVALAELKFNRLDTVYMEPSDYDDIPLCNILYFFQMHGTTGGIK
jgi:hypothetical protein